MTSDLVDEVSFFVPGVPVPQGSMKGYVVGGRAVLVHNNAEKLKPWRAQVAKAAREAMFGRPVIDQHVPVTVGMVFVLPRPKTVRRPLHVVKPDLDKLQRAIGDALTGVIYTDDAQIISYAPSPSKRYPLDGEPVGVHITVRRKA
ncbi:MAG: RusA family crossover junction endodeoxyribonuclease [Mycetocola sp.]